MKTNSWLKWLVVLLLIVNVSAIATMVYHQKQARTDESSSPSFMFESEESLRYSGRWFRDELGLTREQMREFSRFNPVFRQKVRSINIDLNRVKMEMLREMNAKESNIERLNMLSDSIGNLHSELKKVTYSYYLEFKKIINPEQQEKLSQIFAGMFEGVTPQGGAGRGMQGGRRFGWRKENH
jgi:Spy/CpxP family protein refolding chaperone